MTRQARASAQPAQHSLARSVKADRARDATCLTSNVTATVTKGADFPRPSRGAIWAVRSAEAGHVRVRGTTVNLDSEIGKAFVTDCHATPKGCARSKNSSRPGTWRRRTGHAFPRIRRCYKRFERSGIVALQVVMQREKQRSSILRRHPSCSVRY